MSGLLATDGTINSDLGFQTITILPSELNQGGDMNYVLIMSQSDGSKDGHNQLATQLAQVLDFKVSFYVVIVFIYCINIL